MGALIDAIASVLIDIIFEFRITRWIAGLAIMAAVAYWGSLEGITFWVVELGIVAFLLTIDNLERWGVQPPRRNRKAP